MVSILGRYFNCLKLGVENWSPEKPNFAIYELWQYQGWILKKMA
jgi:hypothetical protein